MAGGTAETKAAKFSRLASARVKATPSPARPQALFVNRGAMGSAATAELACGASSSALLACRLVMLVVRARIRCPRSGPQGRRLQSGV
jgi:hypothetical protein